VEIQFPSLIKISLKCSAGKNESFGRHFTKRK
jgi:hypothetical protein